MKVYACLYQSEYLQVNTVYWVISLFELVLSLSGIATCTHRPQGVTIMAIYISSNIYYLLLLYLNGMELCRRICLQTSNRDIFAKVSWFNVFKPTRLHHCFL